MKLLDGKKVKLDILNNLKSELLTLDKQLGLAVIQIGNDPASSVYMKQKENLARDLNYKFKHVHLNEDVEEFVVLEIIKFLNDDDSIDGILVQMPIPNHLDAKKIQNQINPLKDIDGLTDQNMGKLVHNVNSLVPCTPMGIIDLLEYYNIELSGKNVTIVGRSDLVGKPLASLMINSDATVTLCHSKTKSLRDFTKSADILVVAVGKPNLIKKEDIKDGAIIVDVGINRLEDNSLCGDVDFNDVKDKASYITPVPGGVGQMTVAELGKNVYKAYKLKNNINKFTK